MNSEHNRTTATISLVRSCGDNSKPRMNVLYIIILLYIESSCRIIIFLSSSMHFRLVEMLRSLLLVLHDSFIITISFLLWPGLEFRRFSKYFSKTILSFRFSSLRALLAHGFGKYENPHKSNPVPNTGSTPTRFTGRNPTG